MKWERPFCIVRESTPLRELAAAMVPDLATALADSEVRHMILGAALSDDDYPGIRDDLKNIENFIRDMIRENELLLIGNDVADQEKTISPDKAPYLIFNWLASTVTDKRNGTIWVDVRVEPPKGEESVVVRPVAEPVDDRGAPFKRHDNMKLWPTHPIMSKLFTFTDDYAMAKVTQAEVLKTAQELWPDLWDVSKDTFNNHWYGKGSMQGFSMEEAFGGRKPRGLQNGKPQKTSTR